MSHRASTAMALAVVLILPALLFFLGHRVTRQHQGLKPGDALPAARLRSLDGRESNTLDWRESPTLLVLFQSTCRACEEEIRGLAQITEELKGARVMLVSMDGAPPRIEAPFAVWTDPSGEFVRRTRKLLVPTLYWIDAGGRVVYGRAGRRPVDEERTLFRRLLSQATGLSKATPGFARNRA